MPSSRAQREVEKFGKVAISEVVDHGVLRGYGITCKRLSHVNSTDRPGTICQKQCTLGDMSHEECRRRLKRWCIAGGHDEDLDSDEKRSAHRVLGGKRLERFADGAEGWGQVGDDEFGALARAS